MIAQKTLKEFLEFLHPEKLEEVDLVLQTELKIRMEQILKKRELLLQLMSQEK